MNQQNSNSSNVINLGYFKSKLITDVKTKYFITNFIYDNINVYNFRSIIITFCFVIEFKCCIKYLSCLVDTFWNHISILCPYIIHPYSVLSYFWRVHWRLVCLYNLIQWWSCILANVACCFVLFYFEYFLIQWFF